MGEMSIKKWFVCRYVFEGSKPFSGHDFQDAINQEERIPMRENLPNSVNVYFCFHKSYFSDLLIQTSVAASGVVSA